MEKLPLISWARYAFAAAVFISLIGLIPAVWFPLQLGKLAIFSVLTLVAGVLFFIGGGSGGVYGRRGSWPVFLIALLPLSYLLSYFFSSNRSVALLGYSIEGDTVLFSLLAFLAFVLSFFLFRRLATVRILLTSVYTATILALLFQCVSILFGTRVVSSIFADSSVNLVGKWNDLGLLAGLTLVLALVSLECAPRTEGRRVLGWCVMLVSVFFLALVQFSLIWGLVLAVCVVLALWSSLTRTRHEGVSRTTEQKFMALPWLPIAGALVSILFLFWGAAVQGGLVKVFPVSSLEVRPALSTTLDIVRTSHGTSIQRFFVGTGPDTFSNSWFLNKPVEINQSQFWNLDFNVGFSTLTTALGTVGVLGALAWLLPLVLVLFGLVRVMRLGSHFSPEEKALSLAISLGSIYFFAATFMYPPSENIVLLAFALSGAAFAFSMKGEQPHSEGTVHDGSLLRLVYSGLILVCAVLLATSSFLIVRHYVAEAYTNQGLYALQQNDTQTASLFANKALNTETTGDALQLSVLIGTAILNQIASATTTPTTAAQQQFTAVASDTITKAQQSIVHNPNDYRTYLNLGKVYDLLASLGVQGAYDSAKQMYASAKKFDPTNPEIPLDLAHLESVKGDKAATTAALQQALTLKPDYTDAILFVVQLDIANKDLNGAIAATKAAINSAPGVPSIWFELGLLYYSNNDTSNAAIALEQAVKLEPNYANAKYFLGLSYAANNQSADAIQQFKDLEASNPGNAEVELILSNLEAGKKPFDGAQPPVTSNPQDRATAPISQ